MESTAGCHRGHLFTPKLAAAYLALALPVAGMWCFLSLAQQRTAKPQISLFQAAETGSSDAVQAHALAGTPLDAVNSDGHTALYQALYAGHYGVAELLLKEGASPDAELTGEETPLMLAASRGQFHLADELVARGANPNRSMSDGFTALHAAAESGRARTVRLLLSRGSELNAPIKGYGATPLCVAAWRGDVSCEKALLEAGARLNVRAYKGRTPIELATMSGSRAAVKLLAEASHKQPQI